MKIDIIAGARPNFMKIAPIIEAISKARATGADISYRLIHTGQHYDKNMSGSFFVELEIPEPDVNMGAGGGTQAEQTAAIMVGYERLLMEERSDLCLVVGDVTSTMACAISAQKLHVKVAHVEAGIRSGDWTMPEEINRMVTDSITNYFFTTTTIADESLRRSGVTDDRIFRVGNTMIDTLLHHRPRFVMPPVWNEIGLKQGQYIVMTLHRPANVDEEEKFRELLGEIIHHAHGLPVVFPVHPRTARVIQAILSGASIGEDVSGLSKARSAIEASNLYMIEPLGYLEFNYLVERSKAVITDSGGITEETTVMGIPCMTLRDNTERPETITVGTNELIGTNPAAIGPAMKLLFDGGWKKGAIPELWDGHTAERIVKVLLELRDL
ncbi:MAG TPA: UDP-N-acetylglucosamine 2-epimerase (non-hydrolyzing) [Bacteroidales bacterium]|nr:MAG: UDP-N-acetylglucosamine 2-epimerase [Bacteroidetes bacterium GWE2_42_24]OFY26101.1 MAG: UDP-N-acetylglucosamine 2-epimerase [Bacteroidetes bacterium GWF2_43_11]HAQ65254.1 UDP-N-acetylglucosamine 2-epimerase (non-hydrolyzing) [Bacteroidales bacterium]HBZ65413.1 UDP-N-acetylglucosamine 2-epimerase (non-hydrolyzing) [Bacteroidales bacterium]